MRILLPPSSSSSSAAAAASRFARLLSSSAANHTASMTIHHHHHQQNPSIVVIMGATGTGKSKLSIDVATRLGSEIINSDKIQVYRGLDITTNKIPIPDRRGVPHHLLGSVDPAAGELSSASFRSLAASAITSIASNRKVPVIAGGSNSFIHALVADRFDPKSDPFAEGLSRHPHRFRYRCCFIWVDVERAALREYLDQRVDEMVGSGMVEELEGYFGNNNNNTAVAEWERNVGLNKAIGVPEFREYFGKGVTYEEAVAAIKENTWRLAEEQVRKIRRLGECGWALRRVDATGVVRARLCGARKEVEEARWERNVAGPALGAVEKFLDEEADRQLTMLPAPSASSCCCC